MRPILLLPLLVLSLSPGKLHAALTAASDFTVNADIPDNSSTGFSDTRRITTTITSIQQVTVDLQLGGGWAGDLYAYLAHGSGFAVLLNRPGRSVIEGDGSGSGELSLTFDDAAALDIHTAIPLAGPAIGWFQPDGRETDPANTLPGDPRSAFLSSFHGLDANGDWTLFVADVSAGEVMTLESWSLDIQGIPEPATALLLVTGLVAGFRRRRFGAA
jgi:subtilisin-like proprotein convertase family protein